MITKKLALTLSAIALVTVMGVATVGSALAQTTTPPAQASPGATATQPNHGDFGLGMAFGFRGGNSAAFDLVAEKLGMTPTQLFEALHSGQTLSQIATEKGVDLATIETALNANRVTDMKAQLAQAVKDGTMTQAEADWWTTGVDNGWVGAGRGGLGMMGPGGHHGRGGDFGRGFGPGTNAPANPGAAPTAPATGSSS
jgi:hypothetical protein